MNRALKFEKKNIPNYISVFRILLVIPYVLMFFNKFGLASERTAVMLSGVIFLIAGISDLVDGYLARRNEWITDVGKLLDPFADKLLEITVSICMAIAYGGPFVIICGFVCLKELIMMIGAIFLLSKIKFVTFAVWCGKLATFLWYLLICTVHFFPASLEGSVPLAYVMCYVCVAVMVLAFVIYTYRFFVQMKVAKNKTQPSSENANE